MLMSFVFCACSHKTGVESQIEIGTVPVVGISLKVVESSESVLAPNHMLVGGGHLVLIQRGTPEIFAVYDLPLTGLATFSGRKGRGPGEYGSIDIKSAYGTEHGFALMEQGGLEDEIVIGKDNKSEQIAQSQLFVTGSVLNGVIRLNGDCINQNVDQLDQAYEFVRYSTDGNDAFFSPYPTWCMDDESVPGMKYAKLMIPKPDEKKFAAFYSGYGRFRIFSSEGELEHDVCFKSDIDTKKNGMPYFAHLVKPCASEKYIVSLFSDLILGEEQTSPEFHIWDWDGNLLYRLVPDRNVDLFTVDFSDGMLYVVDREEENSIFTFDISGFLK